MTFRRRAPTLFVLLGMFASACISVEAVKAPDFEARLDRIYVQYLNQQDFGYFTRDLKPLFERRLQRESVGFASAVSENQRLNVGFDSNDEIRQYQPDGLLLVRQVIVRKRVTRAPTMMANGSWIGGGSGKGKELQLELTLMVPGREAPVWQAILKPNTGGNGPAETARLIVKQLKEDGLIG